MSEMVKGAIMGKDKRAAYICSHVNHEDLLAYWAEKCFGLGKAVLQLQCEIGKGSDKADGGKIIRFLDDIQEKVTDVNVCAEIMDIPIDPGIRDYKLELWVENASNTAVGD